MPAAARKSTTKSKGKETRKKNVAASEKASVVFPVGRIGRYMRKLRLSDRIGQSAPVFMAGVIDYLCSEMLEGAGIVADQQKKPNEIKPRIKPKHI